MIVVGKNILTKYMIKNTQARTSLTNWQENVKKAKWKNSDDIKKVYSSASFRPDNRVIFNISGNRYRLYVKVRDENGIVKIIWIGTHAEYDKRTF